MSVKYSEVPVDVIVFYATLWMMTDLVRHYFCFILFSTSLFLFFTSPSQYLTYLLCPRIQRDELAVRVVTGPSTYCSRSRDLTPLRPILVWHSYARSRHLDIMICMMS